MTQFVKALLICLFTLQVASVTYAGEKKNGKNKDAKKSAELEVPLPVGHEAKRLKLPYFGPDGKLQMTFVVEVAERIDEEHLKMAQATIETFDDEGKSDMLIDLPRSVLDLKTRLLSSEGPVKIQRSQFELHGNRMTFDTKARTGVVKGDIRMLIYDRTTIEN